MKGTMKQMEEVSADQEFELLPKGSYLFEISDVVCKTSKNKDPMIQITLTVAKGEYKNRKVWDNIILSENPKSPGWKIRWRAKMFLKAINEEHHGDSFVWDSDEWTWKKCVGEVVHQEQTEGKYAGKMKAVINRYSPIETQDNDEDVPF